MTGQVPRVLELGAGTGLTGLALAMLVPCSLHLTDLPAIVPNLASNAALNEPALARQQARSSVSSFVLDWSQLPSSVIAEDEQYDMVLAADPLYSPEHPGWLVQAIVKYLRRTQGSRLIIELPLREAYVKERTVLWHGLESEGLVLFEHGEETGFDDWGNGGTEVDCWWGVWGWKS
jgi:predicted nicotinamide N-methyase